MGNLVRKEAHCPRVFSWPTQTDMVSSSRYKQTWSVGSRGKPVPGINRHGQLVPGINRHGQPVPVINRHG